MSSSELQCPGRQEPLAAMVEGQLPPEERADLIDHMSDCETCYKIYTELLLVGEDDEPAAEPPVGKTARAAKATPAAKAAPSAPAKSPPRSRWAAAAAAFKAMFRRRGSG